MYAKALVVALASSVTLVGAAPLNTLQARAIDLGQCPDPTIKFASGLDGRTEPSFQANDLAKFNHGSALAINVISSFICQQLPQSACNANQAAVDACKIGQEAASSRTGQAAADAFNTAFSGPSAAPLAQNSQPAAAQNAQPAAQPAPQVDTNNLAEGGNVQTFTGALGGAAPPVTPGGKGFIINGSEFINKAGALGRSCDVQHNACSQAANSGGGFTVAACDAQNNACHAAI